MDGWHHQGMLDSHVLKDSLDDNVCLLQVTRPRRVLVCEAYDARQDDITLEGGLGTTLDLGLLFITVCGGEGVRGLGLVR